MHTRLAASVLTVAALLTAAPSGFSQSILDQDREELLKGFDVDASSLSQYQPKPSPLGTAGQFLRFLGQALPTVTVQRSDGEPNIQVKAPFVNVKVGSGQTGIKIHTPLVNIDTGSPESVSLPKASPPADQSSATAEPSPQPSSTEASTDGASQSE